MLAMSIWHKVWRRQPKVTTQAGSSYTIYRSECRRCHKPIQNYSLTQIYCYDCQDIINRREYSAYLWATYYHPTKLDWAINYDPYLELTGRQEPAA